MTPKELCNMCENYSIEEKCDIKDCCQLQEILSENARLKKENARLKKENEERRIRESWEKFPDMMGK